MPEGIDLKKVDIWSQDEMNWTTWYLRPVWVVHGTRPRKLGNNKLFQCILMAQVVMIRGNLVH